MGWGVSIRSAEEASPWMTSPTPGEAMVTGAETKLAYAMGRPERFGLDSTFASPSTCAVTNRTKTRPACSVMGGLMDVCAVLNFSEGK